MSKEKNQRITMAELVDGDRFYFVSDKKKIVQQFVNHNRKTVAYISAAIVDAGHAHEKLIKWAASATQSRQIIYLRNVNQQCA